MIRGFSCHACAGLTTVACLLLFAGQLAAADEGAALFARGLAILEGRERVEGGQAAGIALLRQAAEAGHARAALNLGYAYDFAMGVAEDDAAAAAWYRRGAELGDSHAQTALGTAYRYGRGVEQDFEAAARWYRPAAAQGFDEAQYYLAQLILNGRVAAQAGEDPVALLEAAAAVKHQKSIRALRRLTAQP